MKKNSLDHSELLSLEKSKVKGWLDRLNFAHIFLVWIIMIIFYGFIYFYLSSSNHHLWNSLEGNLIYSIWDALYFSFVTATTTGFGDIVPIGLFKAISISEVVTGLLLLAIVTSKFVSIKQDQIMKELYDLSINEKISRLRSSLFLYKQHLNRLSINAQEGVFKGLDLKNLRMYFVNYEDILVETLTLIKKEDTNTIHLVELDFDFLARSVVTASKKTVEAGDIFDSSNISWTKDISDILLIIADLNTELLISFKGVNTLSDQTRKSLFSLKKSSQKLKNILS